MSFACCRYLMNIWMENSPSERSCGVALVNGMCHPCVPGGPCQCPERVLSSLRFHLILSFPPVLSNLGTVDWIPRWQLCIFWLCFSGLNDAVHVCMLSHFSHVWLLVTPSTVACRIPLSMGFFRQEYWSGLSFPSPRDLPDAGIKPASLYVSCIGRQVLYH